MPVNKVGEEKDHGDALRTPIPRREEGPQRDDHDADAILSKDLRDLDKGGNVVQRVRKPGEGESAHNDVTQRFAREPRERGREPDRKFQRAIERARLHDEDRQIDRQIPAQRDPSQDRAGVRITHPDDRRKPEDEKRQPILTILSASPKSKGKEERPFAARFRDDALPRRALKSIWNENARPNHRNDKDRVAQSNGGQGDIVNQKRRDSEPEGSVCAE